MFGGSKRCVAERDSVKSAEDQRADSLASPAADLPYSATDHLSSPLTNSLFSMASQASFEDSNIAMLSSALHHEVKLDAAKQEKAFQGAGSKAGLEVWRIERFELAKWPADQVGTFFSGDAFIVLHSYLLPEQKTEKLNYDLYFWLGKDSTQDEQG